MDLDPKDVLEPCEAFLCVLLLHADLSIFIKLTSKQDVVALFNLEVVDGAERVNHSFLSVHVAEHLLLLIA